MNKVVNLPNFFAITPENILEELRKLIINSNAQLTIALEQSSKNATWQNFILPIEDIIDKFNNYWYAVSHLHNVKADNKLQQVYIEAETLATNYLISLSQNEDIYQTLQRIYNSDQQKPSLAKYKVKMLTDSMRDFKLAGVNLNEKTKQQFCALEEKLAQLSTKFSMNTLSCSDQWNLHITEKNRLKGLPKDIIEQAAKLANTQQLTGWILTLKAPVYLAVMKYADDRNLRQQFYQAYVTRSSTELNIHDDQYDNTNLIFDILKLKKQIIKLVDFDNYAEYSLITRMVKKPTEVVDFLQKLLNFAKPKALQEFTELQQFAQEKYNLNELQPWDTSYIAEKLKNDKYHLDMEELREYFPLESVLQGLFNITASLYKISIREDELNYENTWHEDVKFFNIFDEEENLIAQFYLDLYARKQKRGGAWMAECKARKFILNQKQIPVAYITCNFMPPLENNTALLTHDEVITIFHEFGHALHHMLTKVAYPSIAGINGVEWDAVELPSQILENWCWQAESLKIISSHYKTKQPLDEKIINKMIQARNFNSGLHVLRQLEFALFDIYLHMSFDENGSSDQIQQQLDKARHETSIMPVPNYNKFQNSFDHIFAGGYAAGYYSYLWAEVMSCDAFSKFKEHNIFSQEIGESFKENILAKGSTQSAMELFTNFMGRKPDITAFCQQYDFI